MSRLAFSSARLFTALSLLSCGALSCAPQTEVVVFFDTTLGVPCDVDTLEATVTSGDESFSETVSAADGLASWTIVRESSILGNGPASFDVSVRALLGGATMATASAEVSFADQTSRSVFLDLRDDCIGAICDRSDSLGSLDTPDALTRASCEIIEEKKVERYTVADQTGLLTIINACDQDAGNQQSFSDLNSEDVLVSDDVLANAIADDFEFEFYGEAVANVWLSDDGYLSFGTSPEGAALDDLLNTEGITSPGHPKFAILPFWENLLVPDDAAVCAAMLNSGGIDTLWLTWDGACLSSAGACAPADRLEFSVGLEEGTNRITIGFVQMFSDAEADRAAASEAVVGIIGPNEPACDAAACDEAGFCSDGTTPCGFTEVLSRENQTGVGMWPNRTYVFSAVAPD